MNQFANPTQASQPNPPFVAKECWDQLRDPAAAFLYAVTTTGVFCRPGCKSRLPLRGNTRFFPDAQAALAAGFRPCLRCKPLEPAALPAIDRVRNHLHQCAASFRPVTLAQLARLTGLSPFTVQRSFKAALGLSPAAYLRRLRADSLRKKLRQPSNSVTDAIYAAGYNAPSRVYEKNPLGMTPTSFRSGASGEQIRFAAAQCSLGHALAARTPRGLCWLAFGDSPESLVADLRREFFAAEIIPDDAILADLQAILATIDTTTAAIPWDVQLDLRGTAFQLRVWSALQKIPSGQMRSYSQLAADLGNPRATRAVAGACAANRVAVLVPCHRVVAASGQLTGYRWGTERKRLLLAAEVPNASTRHPAHKTKRPAVDPDQQAVAIAINPLTL